MLNPFVILVLTLGLLVLPVLPAIGPEDAPPDITKRVCAKNEQCSKPVIGEPYDPDVIMDDGPPF